MSHKFDVNRKEKLNNPWRRENLPPKETLLKMNLAEGDIMADIGCGIGYFTFPAAEIVGPKGKVYALDISSEMLSEVKQKAERQNLPHVETVKTEEQNLKLTNEQVSYAFLCNVLHEISDLPGFLQEVLRIIKPGGKLAIIEWEKKQSPFGPPVEHRLDKRDLEELMHELGFKNIRRPKIGEEFYAFVAEK